MNHLLYNVLDKACIGVIVVDEEYKIVIWNAYIEKLSKLPKAAVLGKKIFVVCPVFSERMYANMLDSALVSGQSRFCSSVLHKGFIFSIDEDKEMAPGRQNMKIEPIYLDHNKRYVLIQIIDVTNQFHNEVKMKSLVKDLELAYEDIKISEENNKLLAHRDPLTGVFNRLAFGVKLASAITESKNNGSKVAVLFIDLDGFKNINDTMGHHEGDILLKEVAHRLKSRLRSGDIIARIGGDEFTIIINGIKNEDNIAAIAQNLIDEICQPYDLNGEPASITASIGISIYPKDGNDAETLIRNADEAMYRVKKLCKNSYTYYNYPEN